MLQEMNLHKALKAYIAGRTVKVILPAEDTEERLIPLIQLFNECRFLVEVPATVNPDFEQAVRGDGGSIPPPQESDGANKRPATSTKKPTSKRVGTSGKRQKVDTGKIMALHKAGWNNVKIADEIGVSNVTVAKYIKEGFAGGSG